MRVRVNEIEKAEGWKRKYKKFKIYFKKIIFFIFVLSINIFSFFFYIQILF